MGVERDPRKAVSGGQAALAAIMVAGIGLTALLLRPDAPLMARGRGPLGHASGIVLLLALGWLVAGLMVSRRYRYRTDDDQHLGPTEQRLSETVRSVLAVIPFAVPLLVLVLHRFPSRSAADQPGASPKPLPSGTRTDTASPTPRPLIGHAPGWLSDAALAVGVVLAVVVVAVAAWFLWRLLHRPPYRPHAASYSVLDEEETLARAVDSGRRALLGGDDARAAVIACYAAMETSLADSGVARLASDSPQDLLERASAGGVLAGGAASALTALFREARYSTHLMDDSHRDRAATALAEIAAQLDRRATAAAEAAT